MSAILRAANRRTFLRGMMGGAAISVGLPYLNIFLNSNGTALASTGAPLPTCFGNWFWGCGLTPGLWEPQTVGANYDISPELKPLAAFKDQMNVISGMRVFLDGKPPTPHQTGHQGTQLGHVPQAGTQPDYPSLDVIVADTIGTRNRFRSIEVAGGGSPRYSVSRRSASVVNPSEVSPAALYTRLFGSDFVDPNAAEFTPDPRVMVRKSVLSSVSEDRHTLMRELGAADRERLDEYFTSLRQLEQQLAVELERPAPMEACAKPGSVEEAEIGLEIDGVVKNLKLFSGLLAHALACNQTRVFNVSFADPTSSVRRSGETATHHILTHEEAVDPALGYQPRAQWFNNVIMESLADQASALANIREGDGTLLDRALLFASSETGWAKIHTLENLPMITIGSAGGRLKTGLHVRSLGDPVTRVGLTIQQVLGVPAGVWGTDSMETSRTLTELVA
jgi:hypothetical protein